MRSLRIAVLAVLLVLFALAAANWSAFATPVTLSLIFPSSRCRSGSRCFW